MKKKVLIVEDASDVRTMMKILVECYGYEAITADDGYEAILKVKEESPHLVLMDLMMPIIDGVVAIEIIRNLEQTSRIPIIAVTAYPDLYQKRAIEAGCNEVIEKPLHLDKLKPLLSQYLYH